MLEVVTAQKDTVVSTVYSAPVQYSDNGQGNFEFLAGSVYTSASLSPNNLAPIGRPYLADKHIQSITEGLQYSRSRSQFVKLEAPTNNNGANIQVKQVSGPGSVSAQAADGVLRLTLSGGWGVKNIEIPLELSYFNTAVGLSDVADILMVPDTGASGLDELTEIIASSCHEPTLDIQAVISGAHFVGS
jgi:hypothetical protein